MTRSETDGMDGDGTKKVKEEFEKKIIDGRPDETETKVGSRLAARLRATRVGGYGWSL